MAELPGASIAVITENEQGTRYVVAIQRDSRDRYNKDKPITYPHYWELPGGAVEGDEDSETAAVRECREEVAITIDTDEIHGNDEHLIEGSSNVILFVAVVAFEKVRRQMQLGDEGQACELFELSRFLEDPDVIPEHRIRLERYLRSTGKVALSLNAAAIAA